MKSIILLTAVLLSAIANGYAQSSCFAYIHSYEDNILIISKVFDGEDFSGGKDYFGVKFSIREALKEKCRDFYGSQSYQHKFDVIAKDDDGHLFTNHYDANILRKKIIAYYSDKGYKLIEFTVEPQ